LTDFSYDSYKKLLERAKRNGYEFRFFEPSVPKGRAIWLRHDVDVSPTKALIMASIEAERDVTSTYFFMDRCPLYSIDDEETLCAINRIKQLGHLVGMHLYNSQVGRVDPHANPGVFNTPVFSIHTPERRFLGNSILPVNAYNKTYFTDMLYIADSTGRFKYQDPFEEIERREEKHIQLNIHPIWWGDGSRFAKIDSALEERISEVREYAKSIMGGNVNG
jgi:hypothetical protein